MLWILGALLIVGWSVGLMSGHTFNGLIHVLLGVALVVVLFRVVRGRRAMRR